MEKISPPNSVEPIRYVINNHVTTRISLLVDDEWSVLEYGQTWIIEDAVW
jgi:hypothetical protein